MNILCPCHSGKLYSSCCEPFHVGKQLPQTALQLMRSRYSAYAKAHIAYLIQTTHPQNALFKKPKSLIEDEKMQFATSTDFVGLDIVEFIDGDNEAWVTFIARLKQNGQDVSFKEKSRFLKVAGKWLYHSGIMQDM